MFHIFFIILGTYCVFANAFLSSAPWYVLLPIGMYLGYGIANSCRLYKMDKFTMEEFQKARAKYIAKQQQKKQA